jgi:hypothetical protein
MDRMKPLIGSSVLFSAIKNQNFQTVKLILRKLHKDLTSDSFKHALDFANETDLHKQNFQKSIIKYRYLASF